VSHIPENEIALYAFDPAEVGSARSAEIRRHTADCPNCLSTLDFYSIAEEDLADADVWEPIAGSGTLESLRVHAERVAAEDAEAEELLAPLLAATMAAAWTNIQLQPEFLTGGVVRRLTAQAHEVCEGEPLQALALAEAAVSVAESLADDTYPAKAVYDLRGTAWKERANALLLLGQFNDALDSLSRAEQAYRSIPSSALGLSIVAFVRATVLYQQQRLQEATATAELAERGFAHLGDDRRRMSALYLHASIKYEAQDPAGAVALYRQILDYGELVHDTRWIARAAYALGNCEVDLGNVAEAAMHFHQALVLFREVGPSTDRVRTEWGLARVLLQSGRHAEAARRLRGVVSEYETRGMITDAALAGLDIADALLVTGDTAEIVELTARLFRVFQDAGMVTGTLTAMAYLKEAAAGGTLTPVVLQTVRTFLRRAERQPELLFAPPPSDFR